MNEDLTLKGHLLISGFQGEFDPQSLNLGSGCNRIGRLKADFVRYVTNHEKQEISRPRRIVGVSEIVVLPTQFELSPIDLLDISEILNGIYRLRLSKTEYNLFCVGNDEFVSFAWINGFGWEVDLIRQLSQTSARVAMTFNGANVFHYLYRSC